MQEDLLASFELHSSLPRDNLRFAGNIPNLVVTKSKYSSTESNLSSDDYESSNVGYYSGRLSHSGFSTSAASSSGSSRKRRKRRRENGLRVSSSSLNLSVRSNKSASSDGVIIPGRRIMQKSAGDEVTKSGNVSERRTKGLPVLNSLNDLKHATGRHRGISGSSSPAVDAALFAMFYVTDIFDELLTDSAYLLHPNYASRNNRMKRDVLSLLRREIVYSLRINYFCPAIKVVKLMELVKEHYPLDHIQDSAEFLDLLFRELLKQPPFLTYSNSFTNFIHPIHLENYFAKQYYYQPVALTVQKLLLPRTIFFNVKSSRKQNLKEQGSLNFVTVPYPALILQVVRNTPADKTVNDDSVYYWDHSSETHHHLHKRPVIPNLKIDITNLISMDGNASSSCIQHQSVTRNAWNGTASFGSSDSFLTSFKSEKSSFNDGEIDQGFSESRIFKGLKSAWKVMFRYLEDLTTASSYINAHESPSLPDDRNSGRSDSNLPSWRRHDEYEERRCNSIQVKMELIAVICKSRRNARLAEHHEKESASGCSDDTFSGYSVYCKAGNDVITVEKTLYAPWVLYQPRNGTAPQVVLIDNFGKWIDSLEKHHESLNLHEVPMEIRRVMEDSHLFIYKRIEK